jgi:toxin ParE1/3/4
MRIEIRREADDDLNRIVAWIGRDSPHAAVEVVRRIRRHIRRLATPALSGIGRPGRDPGTRELVEPPYIIVYEVHEDEEELVVLAIFHSARDR